MLIWEAGLIFIALGVCIAAFGYNLKLAGYSRRKLLEGESVSSQMRRRRKTGDEIMRLGLMIIAFMALFFLAATMFTTVETKENIPEKLSIMVTQNKTVIIVDGQVYTFGDPRYHIKRVYFIGRINSFGIEFWQSMVIEYKDQWER